MAGNLKAHGIDGTSGAIAQMAGRVHLQAQVMAFADIFYLLTVLFALLAVFAIMMRKPPESAGGGGGH
jgi:DHA2 family multidrug resistance protein